MQFESIFKAKINDHTKTCNATPAQLLEYVFFQVIL